jgi:hypothetical protein
MRSYILCYLLITFCVTCKAQKSTVSQKYYFKNFLIETDSCKDGANIKILKNNKTIYKKCFIDGFRFDQIDKIDINGDGILDFIYSLQMDDYSIIGILVSNSKIPYYKSFDIIDVSSAQLYANVALTKGEKIKPFLIVDNNKDGEKEMLTNVIVKNDKITFIKNFSQTLTLKDIRKRIKS